MVERDYFYFPQDLVANKFVYDIQTSPGFVHIFVSLEIWGRTCYYTWKIDMDTWYAYPKFQQLEIIEEVKRMFLEKVLKAILPNPKVKFKYERQEFYAGRYCPSPSEPPEGLFDLLKIGDSK